MGFHRFFCLLNGFPLGICVDSISWLVGGMPCSAQSHFSSIFHQGLVTHALALSASILFGYELNLTGLSIGCLFGKG